VRIFPISRNWAVSGNSGVAACLLVWPRRLTGDIVLFLISLLFSTGFAAASAGGRSSRPRPRPTSPFESISGRCRRQHRRVEHIAGRRRPLTIIARRAGHDATVVSASNLGRRPTSVGFMVLAGTMLMILALHSFMVSARFPQSAVRSRCDRGPAGRHRPADLRLGNDAKARGKCRVSNCDLAEIFRTSRRERLECTPAWINTTPTRQPKVTAVDVGIALS
jgi:hypothetical protein